MLSLLILVFTVGMLIGAILGQSYERMQWQKRLLARVGLLPDEKAGFAEKVGAARATSDDPKDLAQALDAIAVEVERIGEGQRFLTRVMAKRTDLLGSATTSESRERPGE